MESTLTADAIAVRSLHKRRGSFALRQIDLGIPRGLVTGLVGPNGAGKTTLVKAVLGLVSPDAGSIELFGSEPPTSPVARERIGVVLDEITAAPEWRAGAVGRHVGALYARWDEPRFHDLLRRFAIPTATKVGSLSRGERVKLSLAMALAHDPELLVLDEPSSGLDPVARRELADVIREFMIDPSHSVLFSTHITAELDDLADSVIVLSRGEVRFAGMLDDLHARFALARGGAGVAAAALQHVIGLRREPSGRWQGLIDMDDSARFGPDVVLDPASTDDVVVHFAGHPTRSEEVNA